MKTHSSFVSHIAVVLCPWFNVEVSSCDRHFVGDFFLLFPPKKIFVKGLKFKEIHCFLKRKKNPHSLQNEDRKSKPLEIPYFCFQPVAHARFPPGAWAPHCYLTCPPKGAPSQRGWRVGRGCIRGLWRESGTPRGGDILLRPQPSHTLEEQTDSTFLSFFWRFLGQGQSPYSRQ